MCLSCTFPSWHSQIYSDALRTSRQHSMTPQKNSRLRKERNHQHQQRGRSGAQRGPPGHRETRSGDQYPPPRHRGRTHFSQSTHSSNARRRTRSLFHRATVTTTEHKSRSVGRKGKGGGDRGGGRRERTRSEERKKGSSLQQDNINGCQKEKVEALSKADTVSSFTDALAGTFPELVPNSISHPLSPSPPSPPLLPISPPAQCPQSPCHTDPVRYGHFN